MIKDVQYKANTQDFKAMADTCYLILAAFSMSIEWGIKSPYKRYMMQNNAAYIWVCGNDATPWGEI